MIPPSDEQWRNCYAELDRLYGHEFTREARRGKKPAIFDDEPIEDKPRLVELFEQQLEKLGARNKR